jgi:hypothetical protein
MIIIIISLCITGLTALGVVTGHDGLLLTTGISTLCTIAGWQGKKAQATRTKRRYEQLKKFAAAIDAKMEN